MYADGPRFSSGNRAKALNFVRAMYRSKGHRPRKRRNGAEARSDAAFNVSGHKKGNVNLVLKFIGNLRDLDRGASNGPRSVKMHSQYYGANVIPLQRISQYSVVGSSLFLVIAIVANLNQLTNLAFQGQTLKSLFHPL